MGHFEFITEDTGSFSGHNDEDADLHAFFSIINMKDWVDYPL